MRLIYTDDNIGSRFEITDDCELIRSEKLLNDTYYKIVYNKGDRTQILVDNIPVELLNDQLLFLTPFQNLELKSEGSDIVLYKFNSDFYCIQQHDNEVSCIGFLFYGTSQVNIITITDDDKKSYQNLFDMFVEEFGNRDNIQGEMLTVLLKRLIINCTRIARKQLVNIVEVAPEFDIVRQFNLLVELNYKKMRKINDYAELLNKSPKTLANLFSKYSLKSPGKIIRSRILLEIKRFMLYSDKTDKEISFDLGFESPSNFSRFVKNETGVSPSVFRNGLSGY
ncbi:MAG: helix-turn-helix domain-containing protein [Bacteroidales bacterium]|jgi:AraC-like DNA-binding protein|nr:helix-turn-helix domain-containing protein [Bacteroidales bacterium]